MKILEILNTDKEELKTKQANRLAKRLKRQQGQLVDDLEEKLDSFKDRKSQLESISIESDTKVIDKWNEDYHETICEIKLLEQEIKIAKDIQEEMFTDKDSE